VNLSWLPTAQHWSVILLAAEMLIIGAIPLFVLLKVTRALRALLPKIRPAFQKARGKVEQGSRVIDHAMAQTQRPFIWLQSNTVGASAVAKSLARWISEGR